MSKITYTDKVTLNENPNVADVNKVKADDLNEIKNVVNANDNNVGDLADLKTTDVSSVVNAINELIIESGNNYIKFSNGTLICWGETSAFNITSSSQTNNDITLPVAYKDSSFKVICSVSLGGAYWASIVATMGYPLSNSSIRVMGANYMAGQTIENIKISYITIGKWK